jgi:hypothetical protein
MEAEVVNIRRRTLHAPPASADGSVYKQPADAALDGSRRISVPGPHLGPGAKGPLVEVTVNAALADRIWRKEASSKDAAGKTRPQGWQQDGPKVLMEVLRTHASFPAGSASPTTPARGSATVRCTEGI